MPRCEDCGSASWWRDLGGEKTQCDLKGEEEEEEEVVEARKVAPKSRGGKRKRNQRSGDKM